MEQATQALSEFRHDECTGAHAFLHPGFMGRDFALVLGFGQACDLALDMKAAIQSPSWGLTFLGAEEGEACRSEVPCVAGHLTLPTLFSQHRWQRRRRLCGRREPGYTWYEPCV